MAKGFLEYSGVAKNLKEIKVFPSSLTLLDCSLGGGIAIGKWFEIVGAEGVGKTSLSLRIASSRLITFPKSYLLFIDSEQSLSYERIKETFLDDENVEIDEEGYIYYNGEVRGNVVVVETYEQVYRLLNDFSKFCLENSYEGIVVWDSLVALTTEKILRGESEGLSYKARAISEIINRFRPDMGKVPITMITINQIRAKINIMNFGGLSKSEGIMGDIDYTIPAGYEHRFASFQTIFLQKRSFYVEHSKTNPKLKGLLTKFNPIKNKLWSPRNESENVLIYEIGYSDVLSILEYLKNKKLLGGKGFNSIKLEKFEELKNKGVSLEGFCKILIEDDAFRKNFLIFVISLALSDYKGLQKIDKFNIDTMSELLKLDAKKLLKHLEIVNSVNQSIENIFSDDESE